MGKRRFQEIDISPGRTQELGITELVVVNDDEPDGFEAVTKNYFSEDRVCCPECGANARSVKLTTRTITDGILRNDENLHIVKIKFHQRMYRCPVCSTSVFPEPVDFIDPGSHFTKRLSECIFQEAIWHSFTMIKENLELEISKATLESIIRKQADIRSEWLPRLVRFTELFLFVVNSRFPRLKEKYTVVCGRKNGEFFFLDLLKHSDHDGWAVFLHRLQVESLQCIYYEEPVNIPASLMAESVGLKWKRGEFKTDRDTFHDYFVPDGEQAIFDRSLDKIRVLVRSLTYYTGYELVRARCLFASHSWKNTKDGVKVDNLDDVVWQIERNLRDERVYRG